MPAFSRRLALDTAINAAAFGVAKLKGLVLIVLISQLAGVAVYGVYIQVIVLANLLAFLGGLGLFNALMRFYPEAAEHGHEGQLLSDVLLPAAVAAALAATAMAAVAGPASSLFAEGGHRGAFLAGALIVPLIAVRFVLLTWFRAQDNLKRFSQWQAGVELVDLLSVASMFLVFRTADAAVAGSVIGAFFVTGWLMVARVRRVGGIRRPSRRVASYLRYSMPVVVAQLSDEALARGDRLIIGAALGPATAGVYSAIYSLASVVQLVNSALTNALFPKAVRFTAGHARRVGGWLARIALIYLAVAFAIAATLAPFASRIVRTLTDGGSLGDPVLGIFVLTSIGVLCLGLGRVLSIELYIGMRTGLMAAIWGAAAIVNLGLNLVLVPRWEMIGAGVATAVSYLIFLVVQILVNRARRPRAPADYSPVASPAPR
ncbi:MAG: oligosaccharide flippase family protein [Solirubrobacterales bacterium]